MRNPLFFLIFLAGFSDDILYDNSPAAPMYFIQHPGADDVGPYHFKLSLIILLKGTPCHDYARKFLQNSGASYCDLSTITKAALITRNDSIIIHNAITRM